MKVVAHDAAIATMVFVADEVRPLKGYHLPALLYAVGQRYKASKVPSLEEARTAAAKFENALFEVDGRQIAILAFSLHSDGLSVTTSVTDDAEIVLNDLFTWLKSEFGLRDPVTPAMCLYQSDLVIKFDNDPEGAIGPLTSFLSFIQEQMTPADAPATKQVQFGGMYFGADPIGIGATPQFSIARRINTPWRLGLYFSKAHMKTSSHVQALEMLDSLLRQN